jgi:hypothetical protein
VAGRGERPRLSLGAAHFAALFGLLTMVLLFGFAEGGAGEDA